MEHLKDLRKLYFPIQPTVKRSNENITYCEFLPDNLLQPFIYCYWELKTEKELDLPFFYNVVTDGCIDIFFNLNNTQDSFIMGFCKTFTKFELGTSFHYVGVRFLPTIVPQLFKINASLLSNQYRLLKDFSLHTFDFITSNFSKAIKSSQIPTIFDGHFRTAINNTDFDYDNRLYNAISLILNNFGVINLEQEISTGLSQRQLRRLFNYYIGASPKAFCKVVQFQNILKAKPSSSSLRKNKLFYDLGYYDQAHFIKDFKEFTGTNPQNYLKNKNLELSTLFYSNK